MSSSSSSNSSCTPHLERGKPVRLYDIAHVTDLNVSEVFVNQEDCVGAHLEKLNIANIAINYPGRQVGRKEESEWVNGLMRE